MPVSGTYQHRRYTAAVWTSTNPELLPGELAFETDTALAKINLNDVATAWNSLGYWSGGTGWLPSAPGGLIAEYRCNEGSGTTFVDRFGTNNGTVFIDTVHWGTPLQQAVAYGAAYAIPRAYYPGRDRVVRVG